MSSTSAMSVNQKEWKKKFCAASDEIRLLICQINSGPVPNKIARLAIDSTRILLLLALDRTTLHRYVMKPIEVLDLCPLTSVSTLLMDELLISMRSDGFQTGVPEGDVEGHMKFEGETIDDTATSREVVDEDEEMVMAKVILPSNVTGSAHWKKSHVRGAKQPDICKTEDLNESIASEDTGKKARNVSVTGCYKQSNTINDRRNLVADNDQVSMINETNVNLDVSTVSDEHCKEPTIVGVVSKQSYKILERLENYSEDNDMEECQPAEDDFLVIENLEQPVRKTSRRKRKLPADSYSLRSGRKKRCEKKVVGNTTRSENVCNEEGSTEELSEVETKNILVEKTSSQNEYEQNNSDEVSSPVTTADNQMYTSMCQKCNKSCVNKDSLNCHIKGNVKVETFSCDECDCIHNNSSDIKYDLHRRDNVQSSKFPCPKCTKSISTAYQLKRHLRWHNKEFTHMCQTCGKGYVDAAALKRHIVSRHSKDHNSSDIKYDLHRLDNIESSKLFPCPKCTKSISTAYQLQRHLRWHNKEFTHLCQTCGKGYVDAATLKRHVVSRHSKGPQFQCSMCKKFYLSERYLRMHWTLHSKQFPHICSICGSGFTTESLFLDHMIEHNEKALMLKQNSQECEGYTLDQKKKPFCCVICNRNFTKQCGLNRHMRNHRRKEQFDCEECSDKFLNKLQLEKHLRDVHNHPVNANHMCTECGKEFFSFSSLEKHLTTHSDERPHECDICGNRYKGKDTMLKHRKRIHFFSGNISHSCSVCGKGFFSPSQLDRHLSTHLTERSHKCVHCGNGFKSKYDMLKHRKKIHGVEMMINLLCDNLGD